MFLKPHGVQRGAALLTLLFIVALIAVIMAMTSHYLQQTRQVRIYVHNTLHMSTFKHDLVQYIATDIARARADSKGAMSQSVVWPNQKAKKIRYDNGQFVVSTLGAKENEIEATYKIIAGNRTFNVNALVDQNDQVNTTLLPLFKKALKQQQLDENASDAVIDWLDQNDNVLGTGGAEAAYYTSLPQPVAIANAPLTQLEELSKVRGLAKIDVQALSTMFSADSAASSGQNSKLNINTITPDALAMITSSIALASASQFVQSVEARKTPIKKIDELYTLAPFNNLSADDRKAVENLIQFDSQYFDAYVKIEQPYTEYVHLLFMVDGQGAVQLVNMQIN